MESGTVRRSIESGIRLRPAQSLRAGTILLVPKPNPTLMYLTTVGYHAVTYEELSLQWGLLQSAESRHEFEGTVWRAFGTREVILPSVVNWGMLKLSLAALLEQAPGIIVSRGRSAAEEEFPPDEWAVHWQLYELLGGETD